MRMIMEAFKSKMQRQTKEPGGQIIKRGSRIGDVKRRTGFVSQGVASDAVHREGTRDQHSGRQQAEV